MLQDSAGMNPQGSTQLELNSQFGQLYPMIGERQASLPTELNRSRSDDAMSDTDDVLLPSRADTLCDIISSFDKTATPSEFKRDYVDTSPQGASPTGILVPGNLPASMYRLAYRDDAIYRRLQQIVPPDERARQYYEKQYSRAQEALHGLSQYARSGPSSQQLPQNATDIDVPECAWRLRTIVHQVCEDRNVRLSVGPLSPGVSYRLATILVEMMARVITFNNDIYEENRRSGDATWNRDQPSNEHPRDRNLFAYLIGDPPFDPSYPPHMTNFFIIDRLQGLPTNMWRHMLEELSTIRDAIEEMSDSLPMSRAYVARIEDLLRDYLATANEPSSSSAQMPRRR